MQKDEMENIVEVTLERILAQIEFVQANRQKYVGWLAAAEGKEDETEASGWRMMIQGCNAAEVELERVRAWLRGRDYPWQVTPAGIE